MSADSQEAAKSPRPLASKDFFAELVKGSQPRPEFLADREKWLRSLKVDGREEVLFEFEMLLRGLERYFNLHNLAIDQSEPVVIRDFHAELEDVRDAIDAAIRLARVLLDPHSDQKMIFRRYVESQLADDRARRDLIEEELDQDTPQESLFVLRLSLDALRTVLDHLLKLEVCAYQVFNEVGTLALREIVLNRYFRPFRSLEFRIEYDRIKSVTILEGLRMLPDEDRRLFTVAVLALFRLLHYLSYVGTREGRPAEPRSRVILSLVRSEALTLVGYLQSDVATHAGIKRHKAGALKVAREITRESERIWRELATTQDDSEAITTAAVALTQLFRKQLITLARVVDTQLTADVSFGALVSLETRSDRLRRDLWVFAELCRSAEACFRDPPQGEPEEIFASLREYLTYFQDVSYHLLRYVDFETFDPFAVLFSKLEEPPAGGPARERLANHFQRFAQQIESMIAAVNRRAELRGKKMDLAEADALLARFRPQR